MEADEVSITVFSGKGSLHTCTRTIKRRETSETCPVVALQNIFRIIKAKTGKSPKGSDSLFVLENKKVLTRGQLAKVLAAGAVQCGVLHSKIATHSLRRGGASTYAAAGVPDEDIQRFGRWTSAGYRLYVASHADMMQASVRDPTLIVPRFERN